MLALLRSVFLVNKSVAIVWVRVGGRARLGGTYRREIISAESPRRISAMRRRGERERRPMKEKPGLFQRKTTALCGPPRWDRALSPGPRWIPIYHEARGGGRITRNHKAVIPPLTGADFSASFASILRIRLLFEEERGDPPGKSSPVPPWRDSSTSLPGLFQN